PAALALAAHARATAVSRSPDADRVRLRIELRDRDLERDRVDRVAGEEVASAAGRPGALADREQVEDVADVAEERIGPLAGEHLAAAREWRDGRCGDAVIVRRGARADVVRGRLRGGDDGGLAVGNAGDGIRLHGVTEEELPGVALEPEVVRDVRL